MKVFLDDCRPTPDGWVRTYTVDQTLILLASRQVKAISLDNDLGEDQKEGYKVLDELEEMVYYDPTFPIPEMAVHSSNASRVQYMKQVIAKLEAIRQQQMENQ